MSAEDIEPRPPLDWIPEIFRDMVTAEGGVIYHIDWSVPGGRWVPKKQQPFALTPPPTSSGGAPAPDRRTGLTGEAADTGVSTKPSGSTP